METTGNVDWKFWAMLVAGVTGAVFSGIQAIPVMRQEGILALITPAFVMFYFLCGIVLLAVAMLAREIARPRRQPVNAVESPPVSPPVSPGLQATRPQSPADIDPELLENLVGQLDRLTHFEKIALRQLAASREMTGDQFKESIKAMGFPMLTLQQERAVASTFQRIADRITFLRWDEEVETWSVADPDVRHVLSYALRSGLKSV